MRYRHVWPGVLLLAFLGLLLAGLVTWGDHFLSPGPSGGIRRLLEIWDSPGQDAAAATAEDAAEPPAIADGPQAAQDEPASLPARAARAGRSHGASAAAAPAGASIGDRYSLDLGTFASLEDAEQAEAQLNEAGFSTVRFRQPEPARLFTVTLALPAEAESSQAMAVRLRQEGFPQAAVQGHGETSAILVARGIPLRAAVEVAQRLRAAGHDPRISAEASRAGQVMLRHGNFSSRAEAEVAAMAIGQLGVTAEVVQIR